MKWASAISTQSSLEAAVKEVTQKATEQLGACQPDLALVFISVAFASEYARLLPLLQAHLNVDHIVGCSGSGVIGMSDEFPEEVEEGPALSLTLAHLPNVDIKSFHLTAADLPDLDSPPERWSELIGVRSEACPNFVLMADPFSSGTSELLQGIDFAYPGCVKVGGLAGIESFNRSSGLFCNKKRYGEGIVGVALSGEIVLEAIVAQGCRPIGDLYRVSEGNSNVMLKLEQDDMDNSGEGAASQTSQTPLEVLQNIFQSLNEEDRELAQSALFIGVAQSGFKPSLTRRDFLIRNLVGVDPRNGAIAVADKIRPGMRIQFHMRDAQTSAEDLENLLRRYRVESLESRLDSQGAAPMGALLFSCTGRGEALYDEPNFDSDLFEQYLGPLPIGGFFCNGEIGPVGETTFLHGFTSVFGICCQPN
jgi:small ligand-binding sensory domain FIST